MVAGAASHDGKPHPESLGAPRQEVDKYGLRNLLQPDFDAKVSDLFVANNGASKLGLLQFSPSCRAKQGVEYISTMKQLQSILNKELSPGHARLFLIYRRNSWSPLNITVDMFRRIYTLHSITPHFLKLISGFQKRWKSSDEDFMSSYSSFSSPSIVGKSAHEKGDEDVLDDISAYDLSYNIRHFEKHGRDLEDPWSCRQSIMHQKYQFSGNTSVWLVINPPLQYLERVVETGAVDAAHPMGPHLQFLSAGIGCWREYLNYLSEQLGVLNQGISISMPYNEYKIGFSSINRIHHLRQRMQHAQSILANTLETVATVCAHEKMASHRFKIPLSTHAEFKAELKNISNDLQNFHTTIQKILALSMDLRSMHNDILGFQKQESSYSNGVKLTRIAEAEAAESQTMASIAKVTHDDSRKMRVMTMIALLYLPLNLVLSFFSTSLVWFDPNSEKGGDGNTNFALRIHSEIWVAGLIIIIVTAGTVVVSVLWEERARARDYNRMN